MLVEQAFTEYEKKAREEHAALRRISLALRRGGVETMEELDHLYRQEPDRLERLRDIGPKRMTLIGEVLEQFR